VYVIKSVVLKGVPGIDNVIPCNKDWLWLIGPVEYVEQGILWAGYNIVDYPSARIPS